ncbi:hypothetical protein BREVNS_2075 [Brevinematales bacterium NS]|nr:hypothetical protein BREVNS_2075 [Brevinematales bacterium NS]
MFYKNKGVLLKCKKEYILYMEWTEFIFYGKKRQSSRFFGEM